MNKDPKAMSHEEYRRIYGNKMDELMKDIVSDRPMPKLFEALNESLKAREESKK